MTPSQPIRFGKYLLLDRIAAGGMAELYRAKITGIQGFEKLIAIKKILPHLGDEDELIKSFIDEAKLAALLHHQHIAHIYDFGTIEGAYFIAMEYLLGKDLGILTKKCKAKARPLSLDYALFIMSRVCTGLDYAHKLKDFQGKPLNIIHRDISPQNIFLTYEGDVKIVDFGIAKAATQRTKTQMGMIKGKVAYMSPEQAEGKGIDHRSDIFSGGIILYELVTGRRMFKGDTLKVLSQVRAADFEPPERAREDLPTKLYEILHLALAKDPDRRYQSCSEMHTDLEECLHQLGQLPSARGLSDFMKTIFTEEIDSETSALLEVTGFDDEEQQEGITDVAEVRTITKTSAIDAIAAKEKPTRKTQQGMLYSTLAAVVLIVGIVVAFVSKRDSGPPPDAGMLASSKQPAVSESTEAALPEAPEEALAETVDSPAAPIPAPEPSPEPDELKSITFDKALAALAEEDFVEAAELFEEVLTLDPSFMDMVSEPYAQALQGQASSLAAEDPEEAEALLFRAIALDPDSTKAHLQLAALYVKSKDYSRAIESYQTVAELDPESPRAFFNLGYVYAKIKDYPKAEEMYSRVVELAPPYLDEALFNLALVQLKLGKKDQCIENLEQAFAVNPDNEQAKLYLERLTQTE